MMPGKNQSLRVGIACAVIAGILLFLVLCIAPKLNP